MEKILINCKNKKEKKKKKLSAEGIYTEIPEYVETLGDINRDAKVIEAENFLSKIIKPK